MDLKRPNSRLHSARITSLKHSRRCPSPAPVSSPMNFTFTPCCNPFGSRKLSMTPLRSSPRLTEISTASPGVLLRIWSETHIRLYSRLKLDVSDVSHCSMGTTASMISLPCRLLLSTPINFDAPLQVNSAPGPVASNNACSNKQEDSQRSGSPLVSNSQTPSKRWAGLLPRNAMGLVSSSFKKHSSKLRTSLSSIVACRTPVRRPAMTKSA
mmetsp:Transcript_141686/g.353269  ORF Transcript_141686/g.353269 Transcript_141686/m.353269 type:complete len:211 (-) Transcript_141686:47-679(-)